MPITIRPARRAGDRIVRQVGPDLMSNRKLKTLWGLYLLAALLPAQAQEVYYIHTDALGSPVAETDANRNVVRRYEYEPYGRRLNGSNDDKPGYTGHVMDAVTGLVQMQQRYYDPQIGRTLSVDPVTAYDNGDMRFFSRYAYAFNNPYKFTDPDGRCPNCIGGIVGGVVGGVGGGVITAIRGGSPKEILASAIGGAVGGAVTGATLGAGAPQGAILAAGITGGLLGEATAQTVMNASEHGGNLQSYEYDGGKLAVAGLIGGADAMTGGLIGEVAGPALNAVTKEAVGEAAMFAPKLATQSAISNHEQSQAAAAAAAERLKTR